MQINITVKTINNEDEQKLKDFLSNLFEKYDFEIISDDRLKEHKSNCEKFKYLTEKAIKMLYELSDDIDEQD